MSRGVLLQYFYNSVPGNLWMINIAVKSINIFLVDWVARVL